MNEINIILLVFVIYIVEVNIIYIIDFYIRNDNEKNVKFKRWNVKFKRWMLRSSIRHELVHARICNKFRFNDWKIVLESDGMKCIIYFDFPLTKKSLFKYLIMFLFHLVYDLSCQIVWFNIINVVDYIKEFFSNSVMIINGHIKRL